MAPARQFMASLAINGSGGVPAFPVGRIFANGTAIEENHIIHDLLLKTVRDNNGAGDHSGAQTERRGGAGPVRACLAVRPHRPLSSKFTAYVARFSNRSTLGFTSSILAEAAVELAVVPAIHVAV